MKIGYMVFFGNTLSGVSSGMFLQSWCIYGSLLSLILFHVCIVLCMWLYMFNIHIYGGYLGELHKLFPMKYYNRMSDDSE